MNTNKQYYIKPFPTAEKESHISSLSWVEAPDFRGKIGQTLTLSVHTHHDYYRKGLLIYLQQIIHNTPCIIQRKVLNEEDGVSWNTKPNDWVRTRPL